MFSFIVGLQGLKTANLRMMSWSRPFSTGIKLDEDEFLEWTQWTSHSITKGIMPIPIPKEVSLELQEEVEIDLSSPRFCGPNY